MKSTAQQGPLQILNIKKNGVELDTDNLEKVGQALKASGADSVCIIAVMGEYRTGKSFLLDLLSRFLEVKAEEHAEIEKKIQEAEQMENESDIREMMQGLGFAEEETKDSADSAAGNSKKAQYPPAGWKYEGDVQCGAPEWVTRTEASYINEGQDGGRIGFKWKSGAEACTQGIWLTVTPFCFTRRKEGKDPKKVAVVLMDTQGAWDDTLTKDQSATIFGLTALLSSKLIYNIPQRLTEDKVGNLDYFVTFAQIACAQMPGSGSAPFGHLEFLVRDWANYEEEFSLSDCKEQMKKELDKFLPEESPETSFAERASRLKSTFRSIGCFGLPHPGLAITRKNYNGEIKKIEDEFWPLLDNFAKSLLSKEFPAPSAPLGCDLTCSMFTTVVQNLADAFKTTKVSPEGLRDAFVKIELASLKENLLGQVKQCIANDAPDYWVLDPKKLKGKLTKIEQTWVAQFESRLTPFQFKDEVRDSHMQTFEVMVGEMVDARERLNDNQIDGATLKLVASPIVTGGAYFLVYHPYLASGLVVLAVLSRAKSHQDRLEKDTMCHPKIMYNISQDGKMFVNQRIMDCQAILIVAERFDLKSFCGRLKGHIVGAIADDDKDRDGKPQ